MGDGAISLDASQAALEFGSEGGDFVFAPEDDSVDIFKGYQGGNWTGCRGCPFWGGPWSVSSVMKGEKNFRGSFDLGLRFVWESCYPPNWSGP